MRSKADKTKKGPAGLSRWPEQEFFDMAFVFTSSGRGKPEQSAVIIPFPLHRRLAIRIVRAADGPEWLVLTHDRGHGWVHGDFHAALQDADAVARTYGVAVRSSLGSTA
jgi:hypothetical protein